MTAKAVADLVGGRLAGPGDLLLRRVRSLERAEPDALAMCTSGKYADAMAATHAGAVLVTEALAEHAGPATRIIVADPARAMFVAASSLHPDQSPTGGVAATLCIGRESSFGPAASIGAAVVIGDRVRIGARARIAAQVVIEDDVTIGDDVQLDSHVVLYAGVTLGDRVRCKAGAVLGGPGFGYVSDASGHHRIPHVGGCVIGDDVEIGSHSCVDRGSLDDTIVGRGTKIDNMVHIAHNVHIGTDCLIMGCAAIAGSSEIGDRVILAGGAGLIDHLHIGNDARLGAGSVLFSDLPAGGAWSGHPARPHREFLRGVAAMFDLTRHSRTLELLAKEREDA
jgi:UDP-3-O-[3-hydroxymyristoyl] glucosamine N-acyltransferase